MKTTLMGAALMAAVMAAPTAALAAPAPAAATPLAAPLTASSAKPERTLKKKHVKRAAKHKRARAPRKG
jgi:hypothetical protein